MNNGQSDEKEEYIHSCIPESLWLVETNCRMNGMGFRVFAERNDTFLVGNSVSPTLPGRGDLLRVIRVAPRIRPFVPFWMNGFYFVWKKD